MGYVERNLAAGEEILWKGRPTLPGLIILGLLSPLIFFFLAAIGLTVQGIFLGMAVVTCSVPMAIYFLARWLGQCYALTNVRFLEKQGLFRRTLRSIPLPDVTQFSVGRDQHGWYFSVTGTASIMRIKTIDREKLRILVEKQMTALGRQVDPSHHSDGRWDVSG
jgi:hypothetical protein